MSVEDMEVEEKRLEEARSKEEEETRKEVQRELSRQDSKQSQQRLTNLIEKASLYSSFLRQQLEEHQSRAKSQTTDTHTDTVANTAKGKGKRNASHELSSSNDKRTRTDTHGRQPVLITGGTLRDYQLVGFEWLSSLYQNGLNGILADEMGLGKTLQCISLIAYLVENGVQGPFLIVAPLSTLCNWISELNRFAPQLPTVLYHGSPVEREARRPLLSKRTTVHLGEGRNPVKTLPVCVTSYEIAMRDRKVLQRHEWRHIIVDEGHRIKNLNCRLVRELKQYTSANRLLLTGTPLQNSLAELWSLLNFLMPNIFDDLDVFQRWFDFSDVDQAAADDAAVLSHTVQQQSQVLDKLHHILRPFLLRRVKTDVLKHLPKKRELIVYAPMTSAQQRFYAATANGTIANIVGDASERAAIAAKVAASAALTKSGRRQRTCATNTDTSGVHRELSDDEFFQALSDDNDDDDSVDCANKSSESKENTSTTTATTAATATTTAPTTSKSHSVVNVRMRNKLMQLRKVCNHPYLLEYPTDSDGYCLITEQIVRSSGKLKLLDQVLPELKRRGHKVLIFSQFTTMLDIIEDYLSLRSMSCARIDGSVSVDVRQEAITSFNQDPEQFLFLLSTRAGGLGVNLASADTVIIFDSDWNPQVDLQAQDRAHRIGQTRPVLVLRLCSRNTIEQRILDRAESKRRLEKMVIHKGRFVDPKAQSTMKMLSRDVEELLREVKTELVAGNDESVDEDAPIFSHEDLERILDRSESVMASGGSSMASSSTTTTTSATAAVPSGSGGLFSVVPSAVDEAAL